MIDVTSRLLIKGMKTMHYGHEVLYTQLPFSTIEAIFEIDYEVQRQLDTNRRKEIRRFILDAIANGMPLYFSPFIYSARGQIQQQGEDFVLTPGSKLFVIDSQHRSLALSSAITFLKNELEVLESFEQQDELRKIKSYIQSLKNYPITMQIYLNLTKEQERQLFSDTNSTSREAHSGLLLKFDQRDSFNLLTRKVAQNVDELLEIETEASRLNTHSSAITTLATMKRCIVVLSEGVLSTNRDYMLDEAYEKQLEQIATKFFSSWLKLFPPKMGDRKKYVCGLAGIQIALAQTVYKLVHQQGITYEEAIQLLQQLKKKGTWQIQDPLFSHLYNKEKNMLVRHSSSTAIKQTTIKILQLLNGGEAR